MAALSNNHDESRTDNYKRRAVSSAIRTAESSKAISKAILVKATARAKAEQEAAAAAEQERLAAEEEAQRQAELAAWEAARLDAAKPMTEAEAIVAAPDAGSTEAIVCSFGWDCATAMRILACESGGQVYGNYDVNARNGQYLGAWQMGDNERATYGHGSDLYSQTQAAYSYYSVSGWNPWDCY